MLRNTHTRLRVYRPPPSSLGRALESQSVMTEVHLATLHSLARRASVVADVVSVMSSLLPAYRTSYHYMQSVFLAFIEQAGRYAHT